MCGIAGLIGTFTKEQGDQYIQRMLKVIEHRGPDSNGFWSSENFTIGMQRLSIIDLAGGDQPIWSNEGVGIVFNGEIYNFKKLRLDLESQGIRFKTHSDTEVILQLYIKEGIAAIQKLEGMFGICLYDPRINKFYLVRDRLGVKPLYYFKDSSKFVFGSEIKSILEVLSNRPEVSEESLNHYLSLRYVPGPESIWKDIFRLEPGHVLEYDLNNNTFNIKKYWGVDFNSKKISKERNYEREFENIFLAAVEKRLLASDVPVGILLSGGLDSSCVAAAAVELGHKNFHTFSIGFKDGGEFSELKFARSMASYIGSQHHEIEISESEFVKFLDEFVWFSDEPIADLASVPLYYVSKLAAEKVKVVLSGEGSDEVLAGYNLNETAAFLHKLKLLKKIPPFLMKAIPLKKIKKYANVSYSDFLKRDASYISTTFSQKEKESFCKFSVPSTKDLVRSWYDLSSSKEPIDQLQHAYCHSWLVEDLLMKADKMTMATSLELRVPFLDHKLVEWAAELPLEWKIGSSKTGFTTKRILRNFAQKRIPKEIIDRPKQGFPVPAYKWIQGELGTRLKKRLENSGIDEFINRQEVEKYWNESNKGSSIAAHKLWNLVILGLWLERWNQ